MNDKANRSEVDGKRPIKNLPVSRSAKNKAQVRPPTKRSPQAVTRACDAAASIAGSGEDSLSRNDESLSYDFSKKRGVSNGTQQSYVFSDKKRKTQKPGPKGPCKTRAGKKAKQINASVSSTVDAQSGEIDALKAVVAELRDAVEAVPEKSWFVCRTQECREELDYLRADQELSSHKIMEENVCLVVKENLIRFPDRSHLESFRLSFIESSRHEVGRTSVTHHEMDLSSFQTFVLGILPRSLYERNLPLDYCIRAGIIPSVTNWFGAWDPFELVEKVELIGVAMGYLDDDSDLRPWRDRDDYNRDDFVMCVQPLLRIVLRKHHSSGFGSSQTFYAPSDVLCGFQGTGGSSDWANILSFYFRPLESVETIRERQFFGRLPVEFNDRTCSYVFPVMYVSGYLLNELYSRRVQLTPKLSKTVSVDRIVRFAAEDNCVSAHLKILMATERHVLRDTVSFMTGLCLQDCTTPLEDF